jgi:hypothetical protein
MRGIIVPPAVMSQDAQPLKDTEGTPEKGSAVHPTILTRTSNGAIAAREMKLKLPRAITIEVRTVRTGAAAIPIGRHTPNVEITRGSVVN